MVSTRISENSDETAMEPTDGNPFAAQFASAFTRCPVPGDRAGAEMTDRMSVPRGITEGRGPNGAE